MRSHAKAPSAASNQRQATGLGRNRIALACLLALLTFCGIGASAAFADKTRVPEPFSPLTGSGSEVTIVNPGGVAVDEASGNVFLNDGGFFDPSVTHILGEEGDAPSGLVSPFQLTGFSFEEGSNGIAFDNSPSSPNKGTLYVAEEGGIIKKFTRNPLSEEYEPAGELTAGSPPPGRNFNSGLAGLAVDIHGNLFFAQFNCRCVVKFDPDGSRVALYDLESSVGLGPSAVAVNTAGDLFVSKVTGSVFKFVADGSGEIDPADPAKRVQFLASGVTGLATDSASNKLYVALGDRVAQYDATTLEKDFEFGIGVLGNTTRLAVNSASDRIYVSDNNFETEEKSVAVFGPPVSIPTVTTKAASGVIGTKATLNGTVDPEGVEVTECKFEYGLTPAYGNTVPCEGSIPTDSSDHAVSAAIGGLEPNGTVYHYRLVVDSAILPVEGADRTLVTGDTVFTESATAVADTTATLNGVVRPEGEPLTDCKFEYGTALDYGQSVPCNPSFAAIPDDFDPHAVTGALSGLEPNTTYHFRLSVTNADGTVQGEDRAFITLGPPRIVEQRPLDATQTGVTLQTRIDPSGSPTTYHFEFGTDTSYGTRIPADHELFAGSGTDPVAVSALRNGLEEESVYWFRVVATNSKGTVVGPDQRLETLNEHGLPNNRAFELVTPADKGPAGSVADSASIQPRSQASLGGESFMYPFMNGDEDSTAGGWLRYRAERTEDGWLSAQISGPSLVPPPRVDSVDIAMPSFLHYVSPDNSCAVLESYNPLTEDTPSASVELGISNLYRWSAADGDYDLLTGHLPLNPELNAFSELYYSKVDASDDCRRVYFRSIYDFFPGVESGLYESEEGTLRDAGVLPNGGLGPSMLSPTGGGAGRAALGGELSESITARWHAVSPDGSRIFFTAIANEGPGSGNPAVFMREDGGADVVEISASQTSVLPNGARFEAASPDGGRVFFRANYGLDADASSAGPTTGACGVLQLETASIPPVLEKAPCDLYAYDVETGELTDLSAAATAPGAQVQGTVAVDEDGSHVYFAALGQLVPGKGRIYAENTAGFGSANVYLARLDQDGELSVLSYVTTLAEHGPQPFNTTTGDLLGVAGSSGAALMRRSDGWAANTTSDGEELLFVSSLNLTGWDSGDVYKYAAYLYSADTGRLACVSCRPDGLPSVALPTRGVPKLATTPQVVAQSALLLAPQGSRGRSLSADGSRVVFASPDVLAPGAVEGKLNVYQWQEGQVVFLAGAEAGGVGGLGEYRGMSLSGDDVFIATSERLVPQDRDSLSDVYDVNVDGGFPVTPEPPECQVDEAVPLTPNQIYCQGDPTHQPAAAGSASAGFSGPGNPPEGKPRPRACRKGKVRRRGKCVKRPKRGAERKRSRAAKTNRGGAA